MPQQTSGTFTIVYNLFSNLGGPDLQFGMDFTLTCTTEAALCQLIFPATEVGMNKPGKWNIDNHQPAGSASSLVFAKAERGTIDDKPRELRGRNHGVMRTKFAVYQVDVAAMKLYTTGVKFSYSINTSDASPAVVFEGFERSDLPNEQRGVIALKCPLIKFS
ncbi:hypothetical protein OV203_33610 [Nannocystis sp. ILAH1]|uniref:hypothetical protein n=1 Tax=unclassified Nannocystis TaxID=2627009 RepID=UPI0022710974|nr:MULTISPECIES: hypothetical protein [unclassified Nannocystis]MCY0992123.1 hypothetical protein [Nannocystis sp. ILAH1]MCY1064372.1 hypothetical protein [Nannocystis sp. RBIL2]